MSIGFSYALSGKRRKIEMSAIRGELLNDALAKAHDIIGIKQLEPIEICYHCDDMGAVGFRSKAAVDKEVQALDGSSGLPLELAEMINSIVLEGVPLVTISDELVVIFNG